MNAQPHDVGGLASARDLTDRLDAFEAAWRSKEPPSIADFLPPSDVAARPEAVCELVLVDLEYRWRAAPAQDDLHGLPARPLLADYAAKFPELGAAADWPDSWIAEEYRVRALWGDPPPHGEYLTRFPDRAALAAVLARVDDELRAERVRAEEAPSESLGPDETRSHPPRGAAPPTPREKSRGPTRASPIPAAAVAVDPESQSPVELPERIGRYRVERVLGRGGFGLVFLAHDEQFDRQVAVKVPHADLLEWRTDLELYRVEARTVARLDHPHIVPVYDGGSTAEHPYFVVSKYIAGESLSARLKRGRLPLPQAVELVATLADALAYAHARDVVHRDVKPGNVLLDEQGQAHLVDFGLALGPDSFGQGAKLCGTVAYMSPEQAAGRAHQVDGRSDIYSLGVLLYELLTGALPYRSRERDSVLKEIADESIPIRPPRQVDSALPAALERVCLRALAKRPTDRYTAAADMAADLRAFLAPRPVEAKAPPRRRATALGCTISLTLAAAAVIAIPVGLQKWRDHQSLTSQEVPVQPEDEVHISGYHPPIVDLGPAASSTRIESIKFQQLVRNEQGNHVRSGTVRQDTYKLRERDGLQFFAKLSRPAYCFWLGFQPDGEIDLCYPKDDHLPPPLTDEPRYPVVRPDTEDKEFVYALTDGVGVQAFALVVSDTPLPSYNEWLAGRGVSPWRPTHDAPTDSIRVYSDGWEEVFRLHRGYTTRGAGEPFRGDSSELSDLVGWLREDPRIVAVEVWAMPVRPRAE